MQADQGTQRATCVVVGFGNEMMCDEGAGFEVLRRLRAYVDCREVVLLRADRDAIREDFLQSARRVVAVTAVYNDCPPGTLSLGPLSDTGHCPAPLGSCAPSMKRLCKLGFQERGTQTDLLTIAIGPETRLGTAFSDDVQDGIQRATHMLAAQLNSVDTTDSCAATHLAPPVSSCHSSS